MKKRIFFILKWLSIFISISLCITYLSCYIHPAKFGYFGFWGFLYPFLLIANMVCMLLGMICRKWWCCIPLVVMMAGYGFMGRFISFSLSSGKWAEPDKSLSVLTYNVAAFSVNGKHTRESIVKFVQGKNADVVCLQEVSAKTKAEVNDFVTQSLPSYAYHHAVKYGPNAFLMILSRYPILNPSFIEFNNGVGRRVIFGDILYHSDTLRVYNLHLHSIGLRRSETALIDTLDINFDPRSYDEEQFLRLKNIGLMVKQGFAVRALQVDTVASHIRKSPHPVVVCGDFNDTPMSYTYQQIRHHLSDAFSATSHFFGGTYRIRGNYALRIDFCLYSPEIKAIDYESPHLILSDHYPVKTRLVLP